MDDLAGAEQDDAGFGAGAGAADGGGFGAEEGDFACLVLVSGACEDGLPEDGLGGKGAEGEFGGGEEAEGQEGGEGDAVQPGAKAHFEAQAGQPCPRDEGEGETGGGGFGGEAGESGGGEEGSVQEDGGPEAVGGGGAEREAGEGEEPCAAAEPEHFAFAERFGMGLVWHGGVRIGNR